MKATKHEMAEQKFAGTPRTLPFVSFCRVPVPKLLLASDNQTGWCGKLWTSNSVPAYHDNERLRVVHEQLCSARAALLN